MPFVKMRCQLADLVDVVKIKNYKNQFQSVVALVNKWGKQYIFYKFRVPKRFVINLILRLFKEGERADSRSGFASQQYLPQSENELANEEDNEDAQSINSYVMRLHKFGKSFNDITSNCFLSYLTSSPI